MSALTLIEAHGGEEAAVDALRDAFNAQELAPRVQAGPPIEPVTRVDNATWARWEAERQRRIDARPAPPRDARRRICVALAAEYVDLHTASARCPICAGVLAIRFRGELIDLECCDGCPAGDVERAVGVTS